MHKIFLIILISWNINTEKLFDCNHDDKRWCCMKNDEMNSLRSTYLYIGVFLYILSWRDAPSLIFKEDENLQMEPACVRMSMWLLRCSCADPTVSSLFISEKNEHLAWYAGWRGSDLYRHIMLVITARVFYSRTSYDFIDSKSSKSSTVDNLPPKKHSPTRAYTSNDDSDRVPSSKTSSYCCCVRASEKIAVKFWIKPHQKYNKHVTSRELSLPHSLYVLLHKNSLAYT